MGKLTVLVGPNNTGKSQFLRDIRQKMTEGLAAATTIISRIDFDKPATFQDLIHGLAVKNPDPANAAQIHISGINSSLAGGDAMTVPKSFETNYAAQANVDFALGNISRLKVALLDAASRLAVARTNTANSPGAAPENLLQALFVNQSVDKTLQEVFKLTFGMEIRFDYSGMTTLMFRIAKEFEEIPEDPRKAFPILSKYRTLDTQGDGFRSFVGVVLSILLSDGRVILLDEAEAFLHPTQARALGNWIARQSAKITSQIIIATHNANLLYGILSAAVPVEVFRLNRKDDNITEFNHINAQSILQLTKSPLLSSQPVLESIFYTGVVVCEADSDRIFYQSVAVKELNNLNVLFVHAHNKQTIKDIVKILKNATIPVSAITDIDILNSEDVFKQLVEAFLTSIPNKLLDWRKTIALAIEKRTEEQMLEELSAEVHIFAKQLGEGKHTISGAKSALERLQRSMSKWTEIKERGVDAVPVDAQEDTRSLISALKEIGIFTVPVGSLESWLDTGTKQKNKWIVPALQMIDAGMCPSNLRAFVGCAVNHVNRS